MDDQSRSFLQEEREESTSGGENATGLDAGRGASRWDPAGASRVGGAGASGLNAGGNGRASAVRWWWDTLNGAAWVWWWCSWAGGNWRTLGSRWDWVAGWDWDVGGWRGRSWCTPRTITAARVACRNRGGNGIGLGRWVLGWRRRAGWAVGDGGSAARDSHLGGDLNGGGTPSTGGGGDGGGLSGSLSGGLSGGRGGGISGRAPAVMAVLTWWAPCWRGEDGGGKSRGDNGVLHFCCCCV